MKSTPTSPTSNADGLLATDAALTQIGEVLDSINHTARTRLDAETRVGLVESVAKVCRRLDALKIVLVGEAEQHQAAQTDKTLRRGRQPTTPTKILHLQRDGNTHFLAPGHAHLGRESTSTREQLGEVPINPIPQGVQIGTVRGLGVQIGYELGQQLQ